jgi:hypothetical protein
VGKIFSSFGVTNFSNGKNIDWEDIKLFAP